MNSTKTKQSKKKKAKTIKQNPREAKLAVWFCPPVWEC